MEEFKKKVIDIVLANKFKIIFIILTGILISLLSFALPKLNSGLIDKGLMQLDINIIVYYAILIILMSLFISIIRYMQTKFEITIKRELSIGLKQYVFEHAINLKYHYIKQHGFIKLLDDAIFDIENIQNIVESSFLNFFVLIFKFIGAAISLFLINWKLTLMFLFVIPIRIIVYNISVFYLTKYSKRRHATQREYSSWFQDISASIVEVKLWGLKKEKSKEYSKFTEESLDLDNKRIILKEKIFIFNGLIETIITNLVYIFGALFILNNELTIGGLVTFLSFSGYLISPVDVLLSMKQIFGEIKPSIANLKVFLEMEEENQNGKNNYKNIESFEKITFENVYFVSDENVIINNINITFYRGEKVAIMGENGSGKTTFINLLLQLIEPTSGAIKFDDMDISNIPSNEYRELISAVTQNVSLFNKSIRNNIALNNGHEIFYEDKILRLTRFCEKFDKAYDSVVGISGNKLSGGERQKIGLLRALNKKAKILILDEPTSNYDMDSERYFNEIFRDNKDFDFYFIITHKEEILEHVDRIITISAGSIIEDKVNNLRGELLHENY